MAKKPKDLTIDYRKMLKLTLADRVEFASTSDGQEYLSALTPAQLAALFPSYYRKQLPDLGKALSGGGGGGSGQSGGASQSAPVRDFITRRSTNGSATAGPSDTGTAKPVPGMPSKPEQRAYNQPTASPAAQEKTFLDYVRKMNGGVSAQSNNKQSDPGIQIENKKTSSFSGIDRERFRKELQNNPEVAGRLMSLAKAEVGSQGQAAQVKWMETVFNRAYAQGKSISQVINPKNGYWPRGQRRPSLSDNEVSSYKANLEKVLGGSNESNYATDNASTGLARDRARSRKGHWDNGEFFYTDFHYVEAMDRLRAETEARRNATVKEGTEVVQPDASQSGSMKPTDLRPGLKKEEQQQAYHHPTGNQGRISSGYGMRVHPISGVNRMHNGVDLAVPMGSPIQSIADGKIVFAGTRSGYGYTVEVEHADGSISRYAHLSEFKAKVGESVKAGQAIALSGGARGHPGSGTSRGPHLHFEVLKDNKAVDPMPYLQQQMPAPTIPNKSGNQDKLLNLESLDPKLQETIKKLSPAEQQELLQNQNLSSLWEEWNKNNPEATVQEVNKAAADLVSTIKDAPPGDIPTNFSIWQEDNDANSVPSPKQRQEIFNKGGVVVNLDTNWSSSRGKQTGPLVVIPDNATKEQRQAAESYVKEIERVYIEKFGNSLPGKVLTRSENRRGRAATMHTEPFSVNDDKAVDYFTRTPEGRAALRDITAKTLGRIPNVKFSEPHNRFSKSSPYVGAVATRDKSITETEIARQLISDLSALRQRNTEAQAQTATPTAARDDTVAAGTSIQPPAQAGAGTTAATSLRPQLPAPGGHSSVGKSGLAPAPANAQTEPAKNANPTPTPTPAPEPVLKEPIKEVTPTAVPVKEEAAPSKEVPAFETGGAVPVPSDNATVVSDTGQPVARINTNENVTFKNGIMDVTPAHRTDPNELQQTQQIKEDEQVRASENTTQESTVPLNSGSMQSSSEPENPRWETIMNSMTQASSPENFHQTDSAKRAFELATSFNSNPVRHYGGFSTTTRFT